MLKTVSVFLACCVCIHSDHSTVTVDLHQQKNEIEEVVVAAASEVQDDLLTSSPISTTPLVPIYKSKRNCKPGVHNEER